MNVEIPDGYARLEEAARVASVSEKTIRNWADAQKIGRTRVRGVVLYNLADIREQGVKFAETRLVKDHPYAGTVIPQIAASVASAIASQPSPRLLNPPAEEPVPAAVVTFDRRPFVTIAEAVQITGLGAFYIEQHVKGQPIGPRATVVYRRRDLDELCNR